MKQNLFQPLRHNLLLILPATLLILLVSCRQDTLYHTYQTITTDNGWNKLDTLSYRLPKDLEGDHFRLEIGLRNTNQYPFRDIWLSISQNWEDSLVFQTDTLHFYLADEQGKWINGGNTGKLFQHTYLCDQPFTIHPSSANELRLTHLMQVNPLPGINDAGIRLFRP